MEQKLPALLVFDIDRTLRGDGQPKLGKKTTAAFMHAHETGIRLGIASGRPLWQGVKEHAFEWDLGFQFDFLIGLNGAELLDTATDEIRHFHYLSPETMKEIVAKMNPINDIPLIYREGYELTRVVNDLMADGARRHNTPIFAYESEDELYSEPTAKILYRFESAEACLEAEEKALGFCTEEYTCFRTSPIILEFQSPKINKGAALKAYCEANGIDLNKTIAFGDAENDREMLMTAGKGIAVQNAQDDVKAVADLVLDERCDEDAVGIYLNQTYQL